MREVDYPVPVTDSVLIPGMRVPPRFVRRSVWESLLSCENIRGFKAGQQPITQWMQESSGNSQRGYEGDLSSYTLLRKHAWTIQHVFCWKTMFLHRISSCQRKAFSLLFTVRSAEDSSYTFCPEEHRRSLTPAQARQRLCMWLEEDHLQSCGINNFTLQSSCAHRGVLLTPVFNGAIPREVNGL